MKNRPLHVVLMWEQSLEMNFDSRLSDIHIPAADSHAWLLTWFTQMLQEFGCYTNTGACWETQCLGHKRPQRLLTGLKKSCAVRQYEYTEVETERYVNLILG